MYTQIMRLIPLIACVAWALPAHAGQQPDALLVQLPDLKAINLTMADLPAGPVHYAMSTEWNDATTYAREYHRPAATLAREGFVAESLVGFQRGTHTGSGIVEVTGGVVLLTTPTAARAEFSRLLKNVTHTAGVAFAPLALGDAGDRSATFTATIRDKSYSLPLTAEAAVFSRGAYVVFMELIGGSHTFPNSQLLTLARTVDGRIMAQVAHPTTVLARWNARAADFGKGFQLVSREDTPTGSTVTYRKSTGHVSETGTATIRSYISAQAAQAVARATISQLRRQGYAQLDISDLNGQVGAYMSRTGAARGGQKTTTTEQVFADDGYVVIDQCTAPGDVSATFLISNMVGTLIDTRILAYRVR